MDDLARDKLGQQRLPLVALRVTADVAPERLIAEQESLRQVEQRLPELILDPRRTVAVLQILRSQAPPQRLGIGIEMEYGLEARRRAVRVALGEHAELDQNRRMRAQRIVGGERRQPALDGFPFRERVLGRFAETEHGKALSAVSGLQRCRTPGRDAQTSSNRDRGDAAEQA